MTPVGVKALADPRVFDILAKRQYNRHIEKQKEQIMREDTLTVAELINILKKVDPTLPVKMAMNMEYECEVDDSMVRVAEYDEGPVLYINDSWY